MADYPYRITLAMPPPTLAVAAGADNVALSAWLNAASPQTVPDDLGPPVSVTGVGQPTHHWASSASQETGTQQVIDHLSALAGIALPGETGWWGNATLSERLGFVRYDLHPALNSVTGGGVLLEDAAVETFPEGLLTTMGLQPLQSIQPSHPSQNLVWRVRADLGVITDYTGITGGPLDGEVCGYWEDIGPQKVPAVQPTDGNKPYWADDEINGQPALYATGFDQGLATATGTAVAHDISGEEFSFYCVARFLGTGVSGDWDPAAPRPTVWSNNGGAGGDTGLGFGLDTIGGVKRVCLWFSDDSYPMATGIAVDTWYYFLVVRRLEASVWTTHLYVNGVEDSVVVENDTTVPDGPQSLFLSLTHPTGGTTDAMRGMIAELGLYRECLETSGAKARLDAYVLDRYGLGVTL